MSFASIYSNIEFPKISRISNAVVFIDSSILDATRDEIHLIGYLNLEGKSGSKTISAAGGGKIHWRSGTPITFANAGTTIRIGLQDVSTVNSPGQGDGTFHTYADLVGGTDTVAASTYYATAMESGTKTLSNGELICISFKRVSIGGADSLIVSAAASDQSSGGGGLNFPSVSLKTSGIVAKITVVTPNIGIEFDDGTVGWLMGSSCLLAASTISFNSGSTTDEIGNVFNLPFSSYISGFLYTASFTNANSDIEVVFYGDPFGTPTIISTTTIDATMLSLSNATGNYIMLSSPVRFDRNKDYVVSIRPTSANNVGIRYIDYGIAKFNKITGLSDKIYAVSRTNQSGAFADYNGGAAKTRLAHIALLLSSISDGKSSPTIRVGI